MKIEFYEHFKYAFADDQASFCNSELPRCVVPSKYKLFTQLKMELKKCKNYLRVLNQL